MSKLSRCLAASALLALSSVPAVAAPPPPAAGTPPAPKPADAKPAAPAKPAPKAAKKPAKPEEPPLPDPEVHLRLIAPWGQAPWTMRIENDGTHPVRIPADVRLLHLSLEAGDTTAKKPSKPVQCQVPAGLRPQGFPEARALLLAPGDAYVETFDPRLLCFGKEMALLEGGTIVRARYGWDAPKNAKKLDAPFAVEGTEMPNAVAPQKSLVAPTIVLGYTADDDDLPPKEDVKPDDDDKDEKADEKPMDAKGKDDKAKDDKPKEEAIVDEHAPRLELKANPYADAATGIRLALTVTATNVGQRAALASIRTRNVAFRVEGPDGVQRCDAYPATRAVPRDGFKTIKPSGSTSLTILVEEACGRALFRRPGLYRVTPSLHLVESGADLGLAAYTGVARAKEPTLVRIASGPDPFYRSAPKSVRMQKSEAAKDSDSAPSETP